MSTIAYYRVSTQDQSIQSQRAAMGGGFDEEFDDVGVSGAILAAKRPGFARLLAFIRKGDTLHIYAVDRLGRDALDVRSRRMPARSPSGDASLARTAAHWGLSLATVKRYCTSPN